MAAIRGRSFVQPDDVKKILTPVMAHRLILRPESRLRRMTGEQILDSIVAEIAVPTLEENRT
jgi:MoxR-like ATPase